MASYVVRVCYNDAEIKRDSDCFKSSKFLQTKLWRKSSAKKCSVSVWFTIQEKGWETLLAAVTRIGQGRGELLLGGIGAAWWWWRSGMITTISIRKGWPHQNGWILGKVPNGLWPPPLIFGKSCCAFRDKIATKVRMFSMAGLLCIIWSYFPWDACSTTVQHGITIKLVENIP